MFTNATTAEESTELSPITALEVETENDDDRPDDCDCLPTFDDLPCWGCYRDGFRSPNPNVDDEGK